MKAYRGKSPRRIDPCARFAHARPFEEEVRDLKGSKRSSASARAVLPSTFGLRDPSSASVATGNLGARGSGVVEGLRPERRRQIAESLLERIDPLRAVLRARPFEEEVRDLRGSKRSSPSGTSRAAVDPSSASVATVVSGLGAPESSRASGPSDEGRSRKV